MSDQVVVFAMLLSSLAMLVGLCLCVVAAITGGSPWWLAPPAFAFLVFTWFIAGKMVE